MNQGVAILIIILAAVRDIRVLATLGILRRKTGHAAGQIANVNQGVAMLIVTNVALTDIRALATSGIRRRNTGIGVLRMASVKQTVVNIISVFTSVLNDLVLAQRLGESNSFLHF